MSTFVFVYLRVSIRRGICYLPLPWQEVEMEMGTRHYSCDGAGQLIGRVISIRRFSATWIAGIYRISLLPIFYHSFCICLMCNGPKHIPSSVDVRCLLKDDLKPCERWSAIQPYLWGLKRWLLPVLGDLCPLTSQHPKSRHDVTLRTGHGVLV